MIIRPLTQYFDLTFRAFGPADAAEVLEVIGRAHRDARDCGPVTWDEATMRRLLTRPGRYADKDRYACLAPDGFLGSQDAGAALDGAFAATPFMLDGF